MYIFLYTHKCFVIEYHNIFRFKIFQLFILKFNFIYKPGKLKEKHLLFLLKINLKDK